MTREVALAEFFTRRDIAANMRKAAYQWLLAAVTVSTADPALAVLEHAFDLQTEHRQHEPVFFKDGVRYQRDGLLYAEVES